MTADPHPRPVQVETLTFTTGDGVLLEGDLALPEGDITTAVVLAHPHPQMGGTRQSLVTSELFRAVPAAGVATVRFDFRGAGGSQGEYGEGKDEQQDVVAALDLLAARAPGATLALAGWSFGADVSLSVTDPRLAGWFVVAPPLRWGTYGAADDPRPKLLAVPQHDQFRPPEEAAELTAGWTNTRLEVVAGADHFCAGRTDKVAELLLGFVASL